MCLVAFFAFSAGCKTPLPALDLTTTISIMSIKALSDYTYYSRYPMYLPEQQRRETWNESVSRVFGMHRVKFKEHIDKHPELAKAIDWAESMQKKKRVLASQRSLQFASEPILKKNLKMFNCATTYVDRKRVFAEIMYSLLCGVGVGFSVQKFHVHKIGNLEPVSKEVETTFQIPDSIEGWAEAVNVLLSSYYESPEEHHDYKGTTVKFDYSLIRPEGSLIANRYSAPGPNGLRTSLEKIRDLIERRVNSDEFATDEFKNKLRPIDAYDIIMHTSDSVLSGGVRRSATIALFSHDDKEMLNAKTGDWYIKNPQRGRSNNSAALLKGHVTREEFTEIMKSTREFGEPGFVWVDDLSIVYNPCFHGDTRLLTKDGWIAIKDLYEENKENVVFVDKRAGKGDNLDLQSDEKSELMNATKVEITQRNARVYNVETEHGFSLKITDNHEIPTLSGRKKIKDISVGETILIQKDKGIFGSKGDYDDGFLLGMVMGDGTFTKNEVFVDVWEPDFELLEIISKKINNKLKSFPSLNGQTYGELSWQPQSTGVSDVSKMRMGGTRLFRYFRDMLGIPDPRTIKENLPEIVWRGSEEFLRGFLSALFTTDGSVQSSGHKLKNTISLRLAQSNKKLLQEVQIILASFGVVSKIYSRRKEGERLLPDGRGDYKYYHCKESFELVVNRPNSIRVLSESCLAGRKKKLLERYLDNRGYECNKPERFVTKIKSIEYDSIQEKVYCLKQDFNNTVIANGIVVGQCVEIGMRPATRDGRSGWQVCNLTEINGRFCDTKEAFFEACRASAIIGTLQAGYTDDPYLRPEAKEIFEDEALLGCSITGFMDNPEILFNPKIQQEGAELIKEVNAQVAEWIGINPAARTTCVKPAGSTSCVLGTASGIHPHHAKRYIRRTQVNKSEFLGKIFQQRNPLAVEESVWSANKTDNVISFLCEVPKGAITKNQIGAVELLEKVKLTQQNWVEAGTRQERCFLPYLRHNVSNTVTIKDDEWDAVEDFIFDNQKYFAGISLLAASGDLDYPQAPFATVLTPYELVKEYGDASVFASGLIVDGQHAFDNDLWGACATVLGMGQSIEEYMDEPEYPKKRTDANLANYFKQREVYSNWEAQKDWVRRVHQFASRYFDGDVKRATYCMKHVSLWKTWCDLKREYVDIDWSEEKEIDHRFQNANELSAQACAGGKCEII